MIVIDEYLAVRVLGGDWPESLPDDDDLALPASRHWRLLQRVHAPGSGRLSQLLAALPGADLDVVRWPHPEILTVLDARPLLDDAARITARFGGGWLIGETVSAGLAFGRRLFYGSPDNVGPRERAAADELGIEVIVAVR